MQQIPSNGAGMEKPSDMADILYLVSSCAYQPVIIAFFSASQAICRELMPFNPVMTLL
jgi:hypothetical protein